MTPILEFLRSAARRARRGPGRGLAAGVFLLLPLAACSALFPEDPPGPCPRVVVVPDAREMVRFNGDGRDLTDVRFEAKIEQAGLICEYDDDAIEATLRLRILAIHGPADAERQANFRYFVAIATRDQKVLAREEFGLEVPFEGNRTRVAALEELSPRIPLRPGQSGADYLVYVGLRLSPDELQYNRDNR